MVRGTSLQVGVPAKGFSVCLPVTSGTRTLGVILIGPSRRPVPHWREVGRTIALITSVVITSATVLKEQRLLAKTDGLTGLMNRKHLLASAHELTAANPPPPCIAFFLFDVDHFKHYNDTNGHLAGDDLLVTLSRLLRERTRDNELVGRYGGEEFLMVMPGVDLEKALQAAERVRGMIARTPFPHADKQPGGLVSISGGVAVWPADGTDVPTLLRRADEALYAAKRAGRNRVLPSASAGSAGPGVVRQRVAHAVAEVLLDAPTESLRERLIR
jgi:diguanylate cyclase (GGDEF)-like protein